LRQFEGSGRNGAFVAGVPIMPSNEDPKAVDFYFYTVKHYGNHV